MSSSRDVPIGEGNRGIYGIRLETSIYLTTSFRRCHIGIYVRILTLGITGMG